MVCAPISQSPRFHPVMTSTPSASSSSFALAMAGTSVPFSSIAQTSSPVASAAFAEAMPERPSPRMAIRLGMDDASQCEPDRSGDRRDGK